MLHLLIIYPKNTLALINLFVSWHLQRPNVLLSRRKKKPSAKAKGKLKKVSSFLHYSFHCYAITNWIVEPMRSPSVLQTTVINPPGNILTQMQAQFAQIFTSTGPVWKKCPANCHHKWVINSGMRKPQPEICNFWKKNDWLFFSRSPTLRMSRVKTASLFASLSVSRDSGLQWIAMNCNGDSSTFTSLKLLHVTPNAFWFDFICIAWREQKLWRSPGQRNHKVFSTDRFFRFFFFEATKWTWKELFSIIGAKSIEMPLLSVERIPCITLKIESS